MSMSMSMNVLEANALGKRYGGTWALRECTPEIPAGHAVALVGPNGAGKTTLLNLADEPVAMLDPIPRHDFMATVQAAAATGGVSVLLSSHVLTELERLASYLVLLARGQVRLEELALNYLRETPTEVAR